MSHRSEITAFCLQAMSKDLLDAEECDVLLAIFEDDADLSDFIALIETTGLDVGRSALNAIWDQITGVEKISEEETQKAAAAAAAKQREEYAALEWFCFYALCQGVLTKESCLGLIFNIEDSMDLLAFAQGITESGICEDHLLIQGLVDKAFLLAQTGELPPSCLFAQMQQVAGARRLVGDPTPDTVETATV